MTADAIFRSFDFYRLASDAQRAEYVAGVTTASLREGDTFYREGDVCPHIGLVGRGDIRVFKEAPGAREITLYHVRDGEPCLINMLCVFLGRPPRHRPSPRLRRSAAIMAAGCGASIRIASDDRVRAFVFETMAARLMEVMTLTVEISVSRMDARLASLLLRLVNIRGSSTIPMTHDDVAAELGLARMMSRLLKEFERAGALRLSRGRLSVVNRAMLADLAASAGTSLK